jgi:hypothetical protein
MSIDIERRRQEDMATQPRTSVMFPRHSDSVSAISASLYSVNTETGIQTEGGEEDETDEQAQVQALLAMRTALTSSPHRASSTTTESLYSVESSSTFRNSPMESIAARVEMVQNFCRPDRPSAPTLSVYSNDTADVETQLTDIETAQVLRREMAAVEEPSSLRLFDLVIPVSGQKENKPHFVRTISRGSSIQASVLTVEGEGAASSTGRGDMASILARIEEQDLELSPQEGHYLIHQLVQAEVDDELADMGKR